jgi:tRNA(Ile)-lysidine synthase
VNTRGHSGPVLNPAFEDLPGTGRVLIAFSGGPDSVCLATLLSTSELERPLLGIHIDHGLDPASGQRAKQAMEIARQIGVDCLVEQVESEQRCGIEAAARKARYQAFARHLEAGELLVTGHHADDQAETILMRLLRGAGPAGLAGIPRVRKFADGWLARPLLDWSRQAILDWLNRQDLPWIDDPANLDAAFDRNFIRHQILPQLQRRWPGVTTSIRRSGQLSAGASSMLADVTGQDLSRFGASHGRLQLGAIDKLSAYRMAELIRLWCQTSGHQPPPGPQLDEFLVQIKQAAADRQPRLDWNKSVIRRHGQWLWLEKRREIPPDWTADWDGCASLELPSGLGQLHLCGSDRIGNHEVRLGSSGESIRLQAEGPRRPVTKLMNEAGIPPWQRPLWPRLWHGQDLVAVGMRWLDAEFARKLESANLQLCWESDLYGVKSES